MRKTTPFKDLMIYLLKSFFSLISMFMFLVFFTDALSCKLPQEFLELEIFSLVHCLKSDF